MSSRVEIPTADRFRFHCDLEVRFRDVDAMGHVNNAVYFTYFEEGRAGYTRALGLAPADLLEAPQRFPFILADASCRFLAAASLEDRLRVHVRTAHLGTKSSVFEYLITRLPDGLPLAVGRTTQVAYDYIAGRSMPIPTELRATMEAFEESDDPSQPRT
jgi:acyl-CoA thioester hydrolase